MFITTAPGVNVLIFFSFSLMLLNIIMCVFRGNSLQFCNIYNRRLAKILYMGRIQPYLQAHDKVGKLGQNKHSNLFTLSVSDEERNITLNPEIMRPHQLSMTNILLLQHT